MDTHQLRKVLEQDKLTKKILKGVFASDQLNFTQKKYPFLLIVNSDPASLPGTHWLALYLSSKQEGEFYDSYGNDISSYSKTIDKFMKRHTHRVICNDIQIQSYDSNVCGQHCLFYLIHRVRQVGMESIVKFFSSDKEWNDIMVDDFIYKHFNFADRALSSSQGECLVKQLSRPYFPCKTFV